MIRFTDYITSEEYMELRRRVGWCEFPLEEAQAGIDNSYMITCARDEEKAIGVVRLLWDGGYIAFLSDVIVDPDYQGQGIGKKLVESVIQRVKADMKPGYKVKMCLMAAKGKEPFYEKFGFSERPNENLGAGMDQWFLLEN
ncbi:MAG: GNAT family N-acetyltransferase [Clostridiales bacterium]|jgi:GNAT superfamily N-acetyltransferase|nr:GNAT family N-acetyltransferase [Clostridiales bacterium]